MVAYRVVLSSIELVGWLVSYMSKGKGPLGRPKRRWLDNIKIDLLEIGWGGVDWIGLAQDRDKWRALVNGAMNLRVPSNAGKLSSGYINGGLSSSSQFHRVS
jgi:hypothetical protein